MGGTWHPLVLLCQGACHDWWVLCVCIYAHVCVYVLLYVDAMLS